MPLESEIKREQFFWIRAEFNIRILTDLYLRKFLLKFPKDIVHPTGFFLTMLDFCVLTFSHIIIIAGLGRASHGG